MSRKEALQLKARELQPELDRARDIAEKAQAENRGLTAEEKAIYDPIMAKAKDIADALRDIRHDESVMAFAKDFSAELGSPVGSTAVGSGALAGGRRVSFTKGMATAIATKMAGGPDGVKALAGSGAAVVAQEDIGDPVALGKPANSLLSVLPVKVHTQPEFAYLRQSVRTNNAAVVAAGSTKPTSVYTVVRIEDTLEVVAHLSEGIPRYWLSDTPMLEQFLASELQYGLDFAVEALALSTIVGTSGIQTQAYATSPLVTIRKSLTKLESAGHSPAAIVLTPGDFEGIELALSSTTAVEHLSLPFDPAKRMLYGVPVVVSLAQSAGVGTVLAEGAAGLDTDNQGVGVQWSENATADSFAKNLIFARCEGRFAASVFAPLGVVQADLTA